MYFRKIVGTKCYLSPIDENDAEKFTEWVNDLEITQYLGNLSAKIITVQSEKEILQSLAKEHNYSIIDIVTNELLGNCGFIKVDNLNQSGEVGILIGKKFQNRGYGTEALSLLLDFGFKVLNLHVISLTAVSFNLRAIKVYEGIGFKMIGKKRECLLTSGERHDLVYMDILHDEFYERWKK